MVQKYRKKPIVIEAMRIEGDTTPEDVYAFCPHAEVHLQIMPPDGIRYVLIKTLEGEMTCNRGLDHQGRRRRVLPLR